MKSLLLMIALGAGIGLLLPSGKPAAPAASAAPPANARPAETRVERSEGGHFYVDAEVNGQLVHFVVDTGATSVALTVDDARRIGIAFSPDEFSTVGSGASGPVRGKQLTLDRVSLDGKEARAVRGAVLEGLDISLLGQSYLSRLSAVEMRGDSMRLR
jgi:aspartyl protease family protein